MRIAALLLVASIPFAMVADATVSTLSDWVFEARTPAGIAILRMAEPCRVRVWRVPGRVGMDGSGRLWLAIPSENALCRIRDHNGPLRMSVP